DVFIDESTENLDVLYEQLLELEKKPADKTIIEAIFRAAHTLKGMAATMGFQDLTDLTHNLENVYDGIRYDTISVQSKLIDILFEAVDHLHTIVEDIARGGDGNRNVQDIISYLQDIEAGTVTIDSSQLTSATTPDQTEYLQTITSLDEFEITILNESA